MKTMIVLASLFYVSTSFAAGEARVDCNQQQQGKGQGQSQQQPQQGKGKGGKGGQTQQQPQQQPQQGKGGKGQTQQEQQQQQCQQQQQQDACDTIYKACTAAGYDGSCVDDALKGQSNVAVSVGDQMACAQFKLENPGAYHAWQNKLGD